MTNQTTLQAHSYKWRGLCVFLMQAFLYDKYA